MPWPSSTYAALQPIYEADNAHNFAIQPQSYMLPNPDHSNRSGLTYGYAISRSPQAPYWLDCYNGDNTSQQINQVSPVYPPTPAESHKSYPMFGGLAGQHPLSNERCGRSSTPSVVTALPSATAPGRDTPPLSAVSHRSSHTWNTDISSHVGNVSSRTSCGSSQDIPPAQLLTTCEDQATIYPYPAESTSPHVTIPASALPIATAVPEHEQASMIPTTAAELAFSDTGTLSIRGRTSRDSLRTASPVSTLYGHPNSTTRMSRRSHGLYPAKMLTNGYTTTWHPSPTSSRKNSLLVHSHDEGTDFVETHEHSPINDPANY